jgi:hypothetical protein
VRYDRVEGAAWLSGIVRYDRVEGAAWLSGIVRYDRVEGAACLSGIVRYDRVEGAAQAQVKMGVAQFKSVGLLNMINIHNVQYSKSNNNILEN